MVGLPLDAVDSDVTSKKSMSNPPQTSPLDTFQNGPVNVPDFGRWHNFDIFPDIQNFPQSGTSLVQKWPVEKSTDGPKDFNLLKEYFIKSWSNKTCNHKEEALNSHATLDGCHGENFQPCNQMWIQSVKDNANMGQVDSVAAPGVILSDADVRIMPTKSPCYYKKPHRDFFLDRLQNSFLNASTPVYISHYSKDGAWAMIEDVAGKIFGFVEAVKVAKMDQNDINNLSSLPIGVFSKDNVPLYDTDGQFLAYARLGQVFFVKKEDAQSIWIYWPQRINNGMASWIVVNVSKGGEVVAHTVPLAMSNETVSGALDQLMGQPSGWGGTLGNRDCSSMVQDFFRLFGCCLPRNSKDQSTDGGKIIDLTGKSLAEKEQIIAGKGIPYRTILYAPGHVGIYAGTLDGQVLMIHAKWSSSFMKNGFEGSHIIGKSIVSSLDYDKDILGLVTPFSEKLSSMILVQENP
jgi:hypothetical protein